MSPVVVSYLVYTVIAVTLVVWVGHALRTHGEVFLVDVFDGAEDVARAVNRLLVIGFYLLNLGYAAFALRTSDGVVDVRAAIETLSGKVGGVLLVLGLVHLGNVFVLSRLRRRRLLERRPQLPVPPMGWTVPGVAPAWTAPGGQAAGAQGAS